MTNTHRRTRDCNNFENNKNQCLGKRDKSSAGRIDPHVVEICAVLNALPCYYTTSSCAGRCFLYRGPGIKRTDQFERFRVNHEMIRDPTRYFDLSSLETDPTGGGDPIRSVSQWDHGSDVMISRADSNASNHHHEENDTKEENGGGDVSIANEGLVSSTEGESIWLRFEPFILHVACRSLSAASDLMAAARPAFKNVGLTTWKDSRYLVAIWGDEGLDAPLTTASGVSLCKGHESWYAALVNDRHERNRSKINRFVEAIRDMPVVEDNYDEKNGLSDDDEQFDESKAAVPRSYDVIGDVALVHTTTEIRQLEEWHRIGEVIMKKNKAIKVVALRQSTLMGTERAVGELQIIAGANRIPLITSHNEYGIKCVVDLNQTFFSPRMGRERLRICQQVARGEHVLVLFAGVGMEALQIAGRTEATSVLAVELNPIAVDCARRGHQTLERNKSVKCSGASQRLEIMHGDALDILPTLPHDHYDRILAPRPKEGSLDGDLGTGDGGAQFLNALLPVMKQEGGECHWYDFAADHEYPTCQRTRDLIERTCRQNNLSMEVLHVARVGSVAMRQLRVCLDFRIHPL